MHKNSQFAYISDSMKEYSRRILFSRGSIRKIVPFRFLRRFDADNSWLLTDEFPIGGPCIYDIENYMEEESNLLERQYNTAVMKQGIVLYARHASRIPSHRSACCNFFSICWFAGFHVFLSPLSPWTYASKLWSRIFLVFHYRSILFFLFFLFVLSSWIAIWRLGYELFQVIFALSFIILETRYNEIKKHRYTNNHLFIYLLDTLSERVVLFFLFFFRERTTLSSSSFHQSLSWKGSWNYFRRLDWTSWDKLPAASSTQQVELSRRFTV